MRRCLPVVSRPAKGMAAKSNLVHSEGFGVYMYRVLTPEISRERRVASVEDSCRNKSFCG
jgi:hypothetical protein